VENIGLVYYNFLHGSLNETFLNLGKVGWFDDLRMVNRNEYNSKEAVVAYSK
jgi:hypothetical protein